MLAFVFENLIGILISIVVVEILKFFVSEAVVYRDIKIKANISILLEIILVGVFYFSMLYLEPLLATITYIIACLIYIFASYITTKMGKMKYAG